MRRKKQIICWFVAFFSILFLSLEGMVYFHQNSYLPQNADAAIILGHSLSDGRTPDIYLETRLESGLFLYKNGFCKKLIVTGGQGPKDKIPVAEAMKEWLIQKGVTESDIFTENTSKNTMENLQFSKQITDAQSIASVIIVTNDFHIYRAMLMGKTLFSSVSGSAAPSPGGIETIFWYLKEPFSLLKYYVTALF